MGISIIGGKFDFSSCIKETQSQSVHGIFIKHVVENSPASLSQSFKIGDRILSVNEFNLTNETHENAVKIIKNAISPVKFVIQSLISSEGTIPNEEVCIFILRTWKSRYSPFYVNREIFHS